MGSEVAPAGDASIDEAQERQYNLRIRHPERGAVYERLAQRSEALRQSLGDRFRTMSYRAAERCMIDLCVLEARQPTPLLVFIHGGYWRALDRSIFTCVAEPWLARGIQVALIGYQLVPQATMPEMVAQCREAIGWLRARAPELNLDPARWMISGHSAGGQLAALSVQADDGWHAAAFLGISGLYELPPLLSTTVNRDVRMTPQQARAFSPMRLPASVRTRSICAAGGLETDGFRQQTRDYAEHLRAAGAETQWIECPGRTHFDVLDELGTEGGRLFEAGWPLLDGAKAA